MWFFRQPQTKKYFIEGLQLTIFLRIFVTLKT